ncbi:hypothetical protein CHU95_06250 [Niveispirillum lacus]|uniref:Uncharacterized protein n=1 Tax=Niveispirillum lacus TaxID=1981099 RepID=A0A255Z3K7_9PROT|nr:hypothetical protein CHU95_06250 [Niveispirillum lacus]
MPPLPTTPSTPFDTTTEAWFWFICAQEAKLAGARIRAGQGLVPRPCEPADILHTVDRLYRQRRLLREHLLVLAHYGRRQMAPEAGRPREMRDHTLWVEALSILTPVLRAKGIVR